MALLGAVKAVQAHPPAEAEVDVVRAHVDHDEPVDELRVGECHGHCRAPTERMPDQHHLRSMAAAAAW